MRFKFAFKDENEIDKIIKENENLRLIEIYNCIDEEKYIIMTDEPEAPQEPSEIDKIKDKIDILNAQNANLLLDNAKKEIEINTLNTNLANVTLEVAKIKGGM